MGVALSRAGANSGAAIAFERSSQRQADFAFHSASCGRRDRSSDRWQQVGLAALELPEHVEPLEALRAQHGMPQDAMGTAARFGMTQTASLAVTGHALASKTSEQSILRRRLNGRITSTIRGSPSVRCVRPGRNIWSPL